jgi:CubicO group peptidase (beta-lactamase class C family)
MDRRCFLLSAPAVALATPSRAAQSLESTLEQLEALRTQAGIPALGGMVFSAEGVIWQGVSGVRRQGSTEAVTAQDRWHLGSNTKAMTAAVYARLVEQGRADWTATLPDLFPDLAVDPAWTPLTLDQVFGHRAGVLDQVSMPAWMLTAWGGADVRRLRTRLAEAVLGGPPAGPVGAFSYSNAGYIIAGAAIERICGEPWEDVMRRELFEPLGMVSTGFGAPLDDNAWGHQGASRRPHDPTAQGSDNPPALGPAGTVHATMDDYARFLRVFLTDGGGWLTPDSLARLTRPRAGDGQPYAAGWGVIPGRSMTGGRPALTHDGSNTLWLARALVAPGRNAALICVANAADPAQSAVDGLTRALIERFPV